MSQIGIDHFNLSVPSEQLATIVEFYTQAIGLTDGVRPGFGFPGNWLYLEGVERAVLHLASYGEDEDELRQTTGRLHHICLNMTEPLEQVCDRLSAMNIPFERQDRPALPVIQVFVNDPAGVGLELSFSKE